MIKITEQRKMAVWLAIKPHTRENPIHKKTASKATKIGGDISAVVKALRADGRPIVSSPTGFYVASSAEDYDSILKTLYQQKATLDHTILTICIAQQSFLNREDTDDKRSEIPVV